MTYNGEAAAAAARPSSGDLERPGMPTAPAMGPLRKGGGHPLLHTADKK